MINVTITGRKQAISSSAMAYGTLFLHTIQHNIHKDQRSS